MRAGAALVAAGGGVVGPRYLSDLAAQLLDVLPQLSRVATNHLGQVVPPSLRLHDVVKVQRHDATATVITAALLARPLPSGQL